MEANGLVRVRMLLHVAAYTQAIDLEMGQTYEITPERAAHFITNGMAVKAEPEPELEAAALRSARRRG